jgi:hypothetical protein
LQDALFTLGLSKAWPSRPPLSSLEHARYPPRLWGSPRLSAADWRTRNRSAAAALIYHDENIVAAKRMLASGRARELIATYDSPTGLLGIKRGAPLGVSYIQSAALVALALRDVGRSDEASALLRQADVLLRSEYRRGPVPTWFDDDAAAVWALQGKSGEAVNALDRSLRRGWVHAGRTDLPSLDEEPVFRALRDDPGFRAMVAKYGAHYAKEREETVRALKIAPA